MPFCLHNTYRSKFNIQDHISTQTIWHTVRQKMKSAMRVTWETLLPMLRVRPVKIISTLVIFICKYLLLDEWPVLCNVCYTGDDIGVAEATIVDNQVNLKKKDHTFTLYKLYSYWFYISFSLVIFCDSFYTDSFERHKFSCWESICGSWARRWFGERCV